MAPLGHFYRQTEENNLTECFAKEIIYFAYNLQVSEQAQCICLNDKKDLSVFDKNNFRRLIARKVNRDLKILSDSNENSFRAFRAVSLVAKTEFDWLIACSVFS